MSELWNALGVDPETTPQHLTLGEIGMESMVGIRLQQEIEKQFDLKVSLNLIKTIDVKMLRQYEKGNETEMRAHIEQIKTAIDRLVRFKFVVPSETFTPLNDVRSGQPVYVLPPMEVTFTAYEEWTRRLDRPVIGLNWTKELTRLKTIEELSLHFHRLLSEIDPKGEYDLISLFDGSLVALKLWREGVVNKAVVVDVLTEQRLFDPETRDQFLVLYLFGYLLKNFPKTYNEQVIRELNRESDTESKIRKIVSKVKEICGRRLTAPDLEFIFKAFVKRGEMVCEFKAQIENVKREDTDMNTKSYCDDSDSSCGRLVVIKQVSSDDPLAHIEAQLNHIYLRVIGRVCL